MKKSCISLSIKARKEIFAPNDSETQIFLSNSKYFCFTSKKLYILRGAEDNLTVLFDHIFIILYADGYYSHWILEATTIWKEYDKSTAGQVASHHLVNYCSLRNNVF